VLWDCEFRDCLFVGNNADAIVGTSMLTHMWSGSCDAFSSSGRCGRP
jgi:hypothetical protein